MQSKKILIATSPVTRMIQNRSTRHSRHLTFSRKQSKARDPISIRLFGGALKRFADVLPRLPCFGQRLNGKGKNFPNRQRISPCIPESSGGIRQRVLPVYVTHRQGHKRGYFLSRSEVNGIGMLRFGSKTSFRVRFGLAPTWIYRPWKLLLYSSQCLTQYIHFMTSLDSQRFQQDKVNVDGHVTESPILRLPVEQTVFIRTLPQPSTTVLRRCSVC